jgi:hypothetical protein
MYFTIHNMENNSHDSRYESQFDNYDDLTCFYKDMFTKNLCNLEKKCFNAFLLSKKSKHNNTYGSLN